MTADPTGRRFHLRGPHSSAEIAQVGAALRALTVDGVGPRARYPDDVPTPAASGVVLVPWPNRIRDGRYYSFDGADLQLAISEPKFGNASHGLLRFGTYEPIEQSDERLVLGADVVPQTGYPFHLRTRVTFSAAARRTPRRPRHREHRRDHGARGAGRASVPADRRRRHRRPRRALGRARPRSSSTTATSPSTRFPSAREPTSARACVWETPPSTTATGDGEGCRGPRAAHPHRPRRGARRALAGRGVPLGAGVHDRPLPGPAPRVAIEPMTAPANAFATGDDLERLEPGHILHREWGVRFTA